MVVNLQMATLADPWIIAGSGRTGQRPPSLSMAKANQGVGDLTPTWVIEPDPGTHDSIRPFDGPCSIELGTVADFLS